MTVEMCLEKIKKHSKQDYMAFKQSLNNDLFDPLIFNLLYQLWEGEYWGDRQPKRFEPVLNCEEKEFMRFVLFDRMIVHLGLTGKEALLFGLIIEPCAQTTFKSIFGETVKSLDKKCKDTLELIVQKMTTYDTTDQFLDQLVEIK